MVYKTENLLRDVFTLWTKNAKEKTAGDVHDSCFQKVLVAIVTFQKITCTYACANIQKLRSKVNQWANFVWANERLTGNFHWHEWRRKKSITHWRTRTQKIFENVISGLENLFVTSHSTLLRRGSTEEALFLMEIFSSRCMNSSLLTFLMTSVPRRFEGSWLF